MPIAQTGRLVWCVRWFGPKLVQQLGSTSYDRHDSLLKIDIALPIALQLAVSGFLSFRLSGLVRTGLGLS
ncbi:hypothetical protein ACFLWS_06910 [Chloroflexota bacterium]